MRYQLRYVRARSGAKALIGASSTLQETPPRHRLVPLRDSIEW
jgi:hypothetical protein